MLSYHSTIANYFITDHNVLNLFVIIIHCAFLFIVPVQEKKIR